MIVAGFDNGVIRILQLMKNKGDDYGRIASDVKGVLLLVQALKPHTNRVTSFAIDAYCQLFATGVST